MCAGPKASSSSSSSHHRGARRSTERAASISGAPRLPSPRSWTSSVEKSARTRSSVSFRCTKGSFQAPSPRCGRASTGRSCESSTRTCPVRSPVSCWAREDGFLNDAARRAFTSSGRRASMAPAEAGEVCATNLSRPGAQRTRGRIVMTRASMTRRIVWLILAVTGLALGVWPAIAQQSTTTPPEPPKQEEEPFWAVGRPKSGAGAQMAPVPAFPIPTPADKLPLSKIKVPPGFKVEIYAAEVFDARGLRQGDKGTVFVSSLFGAGKIYALVDKNGKREVKVIAEKLMLPNGIEFHKGSLYVATPKAITRYDGIEDKLDNPPAPVTIYDQLPGDVPHGWKFIKIGPDGKLYVPIGAPCNICEPDPATYAQIRRINLDGSGTEIVARGVRNTVGFDFHPKTGELYFTDNQRDWLSEDMPNDELNRLTQVGQHFGYPYCHQGDFADPQFGWGKACDDFVKPILLLGPHSAPLGMRFYTGKMFPQKYQGAIFIARHGPWNRTKKYAADVVAVFLKPDGTVKSMEPFLTGLVENNSYLGRPVDVLVLKDGSLLVSDDHAGAVYRVSYQK